MKDIVFVAGSIGSAKIILSIIRFINQKKYNFFFLISDFLKEKYKNLYYSKIEVDKNISKFKTFKILKKINPDIIFAGSGGDNLIEFYATEFANQHNIFSFTILDSWTHIKKRFFRVIDGKVTYNIPSKVGLPNREAFIRLKKDKKFLNKIFISGFPHMNDTVNSYFKNYNKKKISSNNINILYLSTPMETSKYIPNTQDDIFFDQKKIIEYLVQSIDKVNKKYITNDIKLTLLIKLHPLENLNDIKIFLKNIKKKYTNLNITIINYKDNFKCFLSSFVTFGITSSMLLESILCKIDTFSLQIGNGFNKKNNFFKNIKKLKVIDNKNDINKILINIIKKNSIKDSSKKINFKKEVKIQNFFKKFL